MINISTQLNNLPIDALALLMSGGDINEVMRRLMNGDMDDDVGEEVNL